jgi:XTP/dITP diphosphohydrolase
MPDLLIATTNPGKRVELQALFAELSSDPASGKVLSSLRLVLPAELGIALEVEENGTTYAENAILKARAFQQASGLVTLADDSGLEVEPLGGAPGVYSARYSPKPGAKDADRRALLLENLKSLPRPWKARFCCSVAIAIPGGDVRLVDGFCPGEIIPEERGNNGFGYDPVFYLPELGRTMAELSMAEKNRLSHRARAFQAAVPVLSKLFSEGE